MTLPLFLNLYNFCTCYVPTLWFLLEYQFIWYCYKFLKQSLIGRSQKRWVFEDLQEPPLLRSYQIKVSLKKDRATCHLCAEKSDWKSRQPLLALHSVAHQSKILELNLNIWTWNRKKVPRAPLKRLNPMQKMVSATMGFRILLTTLLKK